MKKSNATAQIKPIAIQKHPLIFLFCLISLLTAPPVFGCLPDLHEINWKSWLFNQELTQFNTSKQQYLGPYNVYLSKSNLSEGTQIKVTKNRNVSAETQPVLYQWKGHSESPFIFIKKDIIVHTLHSPITSGANILAFDLKKKRLLWNTQLQGLGLIQHSQYRNKININYDSKKNWIIIYGQESNGRYIEILSAKNGKQIFHKTLPVNG